jgi:hypothetical protein
MYDEKGKKPWEKREAKIRKVLSYIDEGIMQDHQPDDEPPTMKEFRKSKTQEPVKAMFSF